MRDTRQTSRADERTPRRVALVFLLAIALSACGPSRGTDLGPGAPTSTLPVETSTVPADGSTGGGSDGGPFGGTDAPEDTDPDCGCDDASSDDGEDGTSSDDGGGDAGGFDGADGAGDGAGDLRHDLEPRCIHGVVEGENEERIPGATVTAYATGRGVDSGTAAKTGRAGHYCIAKEPGQDVVAVTTARGRRIEHRIGDVWPQARDAHGCIGVRMVITPDR